MTARTPLAFLVAAMAALVFARCGQASGAGGTERDAERSSDRAAYDAPTPLPQPVVFAPGTISTGDDDAHVTFTASGDSVYFIRSTPTFGHWTVLISRYADGKWQTPEVAPFSGRYHDADVSFAPDGNSIFFVSNRPVRPGDPPKEDTDIWVMRRTAGGWSEPRNLGDSINSDGWEFGAKLSPDGRYLFFTSNRSVLDKPLPRRLDFRELNDALRSPGNGLRDVYQVDVSALRLEGR